MKKRLKSINNGYRVIYTVIIGVLLVCLFLTTMAFVYSDARDRGLESLHIQTKEIKSDIQLQVASDMENLTTIANFAAKLRKNGEDYSMLLKSFKAIGLIDNIGFLMPDGSIVSKNGSIRPLKEISFYSESRRGAYVSGKEPDVTKDDRYVVRMAVPVTVDGEVVSVLYGVANLSTMLERFTPSEDLGEYQLYVIDRKSGDFIIDTRNNDVKNISSLADRRFEEGYTFETLRNDIMTGSNGFSSFVSKLSGRKLFIHYSPVNVSDWHIMLALPEDNVFTEARTTMRWMFVVLLFAVLFMAVYVLIMVRIENRQSRINSTASRIRKLLLEINQHDSSINLALEAMAGYAKARSAIYTDTDGLDYHYINPAFSSRLLIGDDKKLFVHRLEEYIRNVFAEKDISLGVMRIERDKELFEKDREFYEFLGKRGIDNVCFVGLFSKMKDLSILAVINCKKNKNVKDLLNEIAVCFSIAIHNKKYLGQTEMVAVTDSLTGLSNRLAYKKDIRMYEDRHPEMFSCIYIDVNELHVINNRFGHAAGDNMLLYIANILKSEFEGCSIYRMGGDEFLVFAENISVDDVNTRVSNVIKKAEEKQYHISVGVDFESINFDVEIAVKEAEKRMYENKAEYYQKKGAQTIIREQTQDVERIVTGIKELDVLLSVISERYVGIYNVNLKSDSPRPLLIPSSLKKYYTPDSRFSDVFSKYIHDVVKSDYHRPLLNFLEYDVMKRQLSDGKVLSTEYERITGERFRISVYLLADEENSVNTLWIFERI